MQGLIKGVWDIAGFVGLSRDLARIYGTSARICGTQLGFTGFVGLRQDLWEIERINGTQQGFAGYSQDLWELVGIVGLRKYLGSICRGYRNKGNCGGCMVSWGLHGAKNCEKKIFLGNLTIDALLLKKFEGAQTPNPNPHVRSPQEAHNTQTTCLSCIWLVLSYRATPNRIPYSYLFDFENKYDSSKRSFKIWLAPSCAKAKSTKMTFFFSPK